MITLLTLLATPALVAPAPAAINTQVPRRDLLYFTAKAGPGYISWTTRNATDVWIDGLAGVNGQPGNNMRVKGASLSVPPGRYYFHVLGPHGQDDGCWLDVN